MPALYVCDIVLVSLLQICLVSNLLTPPPWKGGFLLFAH